MNLPGFSGLRNHLPDYTEKQAKSVAALLPRISIVSFLLSMIMDYSMRILYSIFPNMIFVVIEPWIPIFITLLLIYGGSRVAQIGFVRKNKLMSEDRRTAYQKVAKIVFTGIGMAFGGLFYGLLQHYKLPFGLNPDFIPISESTTLMADSIFSLWFNVTWDVYPRLIIGVFLFIIAIAAAARSIIAFGIDNAGLVYVYYPEESKVVQNDIYSIVRHPMYMSVILMSISGFVLHFSIYSVIHLIITLGSFAFHILCREEIELVERFGESYLEYKKKVPAIFIRPKNWKKLFVFISGQGQKDEPITDTSTTK